ESSVFSQSASAVLSHSLFFLSAPAPTEIYTLSLHDALPISRGRRGFEDVRAVARSQSSSQRLREKAVFALSQSQEPEALRRRLRSEEHTSELQSLRHLVCRLLLEKKNKKQHREHSSELSLGE